MLGAWKPKPDLPLYKDKPSQARSKSKSGLVMLFKGFVASLALYIVFNYLSSRSVLTGPTTWAEKQDEVRQVFLQLWESYVEDAWGYDIYHPVTRSGENMGPKPLGWIIVDALDTLYIMGCEKEAAKARDWVKHKLDYKFDYAVNVFETTIRMLGGLLSAHHWSGNDDLYLDKAADLAHQILGAFSSDLGLPYASVNLLTGKGIKNHVDGGASSTAEVATLQLEFKYLAKLTGETLYWEKVEKVMQILESNKPEAGLVPIYVNPDSGRYQGNLIRLGLRGDSYYEYLLKQYLQTGKKETIYSDMYRESVNGVREHLIGKSSPSQLTFVGELEQGIGHGLLTKMDHLVCFYGGLLALGATGGLTVEEAKKAKVWKDELASDFKLAEELTETCYRMYHDVPATGLSPEIVVFNQDHTVNQDFHIKPRDTHNLQRPETVESLFILYRLTGDEKYREWGWEIFQNFVKHTRVVGDDGRVTYTTLEDVTKSPPKKGDNMELFWLAETLKYLYLLFDDNNKVPLDQYVFNTEAHPFPVFDMNPLFKTGWIRLGKKANPDKGSDSDKKVKSSEQKKANVQKDDSKKTEKTEEKPKKVNTEKTGQNLKDSKHDDVNPKDSKPKDAKAENIKVKADKIDSELIDEKLAAEVNEKFDSHQKKKTDENEPSDIELENEAKKDVPPPPPNVDKKHPPKAAPANKKIDEEVQEVAKEDPSVVE